MRIRYRYARSLLAGFLAVVLLFSLVIPIPLLSV